MKPKKDLTKRQKATLERLAKAGKTVSEVHAALEKAGARMSRRTVGRRMREVLGAQRTKPKKSTPKAAPKKPPRSRSKEKKTEPDEPKPETPAQRKARLAEEQRRLEEARANPMTLDDLAAELAVAAEDARRDGNFPVVARIAQLRIQAKVAAERFRARDEGEGLIVDPAEIRKAARTCRTKLLEAVARAQEIDEAS